MLDSILRTPVRRRESKHEEEPEKVKAHSGGGGNLSVASSCRPSDASEVKKMSLSSLPLMFSHNHALAITLIDAIAQATCIFQGASIFLQQWKEDSQTVPLIGGVHTPTSVQIEKLMDYHLLSRCFPLEDVITHLLLILTYQKKIIHS